MYQINASIDAIVGQAATRAEALEDDYGAPDVLRRGLLTTDECQELFELCVVPPLPPSSIRLDLFRVRSRAIRKMTTDSCLPTRTK